MDALYSSTTTTVEQPTDRRFRIPWSRKAIPLKQSILFNKVKHSEEWHQSIDATAGVLHPSDQKFPFGFLRNHTEAYLKKKGKINQADIDIKLGILITSHDERDLAVAAAAHAMTAKSLRALLHSDLNIMQGSYWGLKTWLRCLIAANDGNAASVTDLEATFARKLLPFAMQGPRAAEWLLVGICRTLREMSISDMNLIPEFALLTKKAIEIYALQLEGLRLSNDWVAVYESVLWMVELAKTSPVTAPSGYLLPEHFLDSQFPAWRIYTRWKPDLERIKLLARSKRDDLAVVSDLVALEGPDMMTGQENTLRDGLTTQYKGTKTLLQWRGIIIEVPDRTQESLGAILAQVAQLLAVITINPGLDHEYRFELFRFSTIARPITTTNLKIFEETCRIPYAPDTNIYNAVREVLENQQQLAGENTLAIQNLLRVLIDYRASYLQDVFLQDWLRLGIENCVQECQGAVRAHIDLGLSWTQLAIEYHSFCTVVEASEKLWPEKHPTMKISQQRPSLDDLKIVTEIHDALQLHRINHSKGSTTSPSKVYVSSDLLGEEHVGVHPILKHVEAFCIDRVLGQEAMSESAERIIEAMMHVWKSTSKPIVDLRRRDLAILVLESAGNDFSLACRCLTNITFASLLDTSVMNLIIVLRKSESELSEAIVDFVRLVTALDKTWAECWKDLLYSWIERQAQPAVFKQQDDVLQRSLKTMSVVEWLPFMRRVGVLFGERNSGHTVWSKIPPLVHPLLFKWTATLIEYTGTLTRLETVLGPGHEAMRFLLAYYIEARISTTNLLHLQKAQEMPVENLMQRMIGKLSTKASREPKVQDCLIDLARATPETIDICYRVWDAKHEGLEIPGLPNITSTQAQSQEKVAHHHASLESDVTGASSLTSVRPWIPTKFASRRAVPSAVVEVMVSGYMRSDEFSDIDKSAIASLATLLEIDVDPVDKSAWNSKLNEATQFWELIETEILREAARLESLVKTLKVKDPKATKLLCEELGIKCNNALDDEMEHLPPGLIDVVERMGENEVDISFSLHAFTDLQRGAMGIPEGATSLLLRLYVPTIDEMPYTFCIHFNNDKDIDTIDYKHFGCLPGSKSPPESICTTNLTAFVWQLRRIIHTKRQDGCIKIVDIHKYVKTKMDCLGNFCVACNTSHLAASKAQIRRSVPCNLLACARLWYDLPLDVRVPEIRTDLYVVDLMLTSVHAAAMSGRTELLPACPIRDFETIKYILSCLPKLTLVRDAVNISAVLASYHEDAETFISWACVHHRGYIATAAGLSKIPTMPKGTHQFVLANASPKQESDFVSKITSKTKTTALFHGTTFDRLPAILAQGLRVCSGTSLQRTGAAHGKGIYMAEEPHTSLIYSAPSTSWRNSGLANMRLLLGCEVIAGAGRNPTSTIHVITDELSVIVRYMFLLPGEARVPIANHVVPAMGSGMSALRSGAV
jgi:hypothetical protein